MADPSPGLPDGHPPWAGKFPNSVSADPAKHAVIEQAHDQPVGPAGGRAGGQLRRQFPDRRLRFHPRRQRAPGRSWPPSSACQTLGQQRDQRWVGPGAPDPVPRLQLHATSGPPAPGPSRPAAGKRGQRASFARTARGALEKIHQGARDDGAAAPLGAAAGSRPQSLPPLGVTQHRHPLEGIVEVATPTGRPAGPPAGRSPRKWPRCRQRAPGAAAVPTSRPFSPSLTSREARPAGGHHRQPVGHRLVHHQRRRLFDPGGQVHEQVGRRHQAGAGVGQQLERVLQHHHPVGDAAARARWRCSMVNARSTCTPASSNTAAAASRSPRASARSAPADPPWCPGSAAKRPGTPRRRRAQPEPPPGLLPEPGRVAVGLDVDAVGDHLALLGKAGLQPQPLRPALPTPRETGSGAARDLKMKPSLGRTPCWPGRAAGSAHWGPAWVVPTVQITGAQSAWGRSTQGTGPTCSPLAR